MQGVFFVFQMYRKIKCKDIRIIATTPIVRRGLLPNGKVVEISRCKRTVLNNIRQYLRKILALVSLQDSCSFIASENFSPQVRNSSLNESRLRDVRTAKHCDVTSHCCSVPYSHIASLLSISFTTAARHFRRRFSSFLLAIMRQFA